MYNNEVYMFILILNIFQPVTVFCQPQLSSSIGSLELSGEQCPGALTLTCNVRNFGNAESINWFVDDDRVAVFDLAVHSTPFTSTTTRPDLLNATVKLESATFSDGQFSFINFTLSAGLSDFLSLQGQNITCGSVRMKSTSFEITEFTLKNESSYPDTEVSYLAKYNGLDGKLAEMKLEWTERVSNCTNMVSYSVNISNKEMSMRRNFTSEVCSSSQCSYEIDFTQNITSDVIVEFYADGNLISTNTIAGTTGNNVSVDECSGEVSIRCSDLNTNQSCTIKYQQDGMYLNKTIQPSSMVSFPLESELFQVVIKNGSTILEQGFDNVVKDVGSSVAALVGVGVALFGLGLIEHLVAVLVFLFCVCKKKQGKRWKLLLFIATVMYFLFAIVWIVAFTTYTQISCGTLRSTGIAIHIVALVLSILSTVISTLVLALILIMCHSMKYEMGGLLELPLEKSYDFTFGITSPTFSQHQLESQCPNCCEFVSSFQMQLTPLYCDICGKQMCTKCENKTFFVFRMMGPGQACMDCEVEYWKQNEQFANNDDSIGEMSLLWRKKCGEPCLQCDQSTDTNLTCDFCSKGICSSSHTRAITEDEEMVDDKIASETGQNGKQIESQEISDGETQANGEEVWSEMSVMSSLSKMATSLRLGGRRNNTRKEHQVCRLCYTVCKRKEHYIKTL